MHDSPNSHDPKLPTSDADSERLSAIEARLLGLYRRLSEQDQYYLRRLAEAMGMVTDTVIGLPEGRPENEDNGKDEERRNESYSLQRVQA